jgi:hypothetical protein
MTTYVNMNDKLYDEILLKLRRSYQNSCVLWIEKMENADLEHKYEQQKSDLLQKRGVDGVKEVEMYHGTTEEIARIIAKDGFNPDMNKKSMYGKGTYFARNASYSKNYAPPSSHNEVSFMLLCSVIVGNIGFFGRDAVIDTTKFDNSMDPSGGIIVTPYRYGAIPRYLVAFYRNV